MSVERACKLRHELHPESGQALAVFPEARTDDAPQWSARMRLSALMLAALFVGVASSARAETIMCPAEISRGVLPGNEGWTLPRADTLALRNAYLSGRSLQCSYASGVTITRPAPAGNICRSVPGGFECRFDGSTVLQGVQITAPPLLRPVCRVDPAVSTITLTKGERAGQVRIGYEIMNRGVNAWRSGPGEAAVELVVTDSETGRAFRERRALPEAAEAGASMLVFTLLFEDPFSFSGGGHDFSGGEVTVSITFSPGVDLNSGLCIGNNDVARISHAEIAQFMRGPERTRTWRF